MALTKCIECGQMVSDKATSCPHCGAPIVKTIVCEDCGTEIPEGTKTCPTCGCPIEHARTASSNFSSTGQMKSAPKFQAFTSDMDQRVQRFLMTNRKYLPTNRFEEIRSWLLTLDDKKWELLNAWCSRILL